MIDINKEDYYLHSHRTSETDSITKNRLIEMNLLGMEDFGNGDFGVRNITSGLYIELVWNYSDSDFKNYIDWIKIEKIKKY